MKHQKKKDLLLFAIKLIKNLPDTSNAKEQDKLFLKTKTINWLNDQK